MQSRQRILVLITVAGLAGCAGTAPTPDYAQSRAISQDIDATHVKGPTTTSPSQSEANPAPTLAPWRNEEIMDHIKTLRNGG